MRIRGMFSLATILLACSAMVFSVEEEGPATTWEAIVCAYGTNTVVPISLPSTPLSPVSTTGNPWAIAITPDRTTAIVSDFSNPDIMVLDLTTNPISPKHLPLTIGATGSRGAAISPDGRWGYVCCSSNGTVYAIDLTALDNPAVAILMDSSGTPPNPLYIAFSPTKNEAYVSCDDGTVKIIDTIAQSVNGRSYSVPNALSLAVTPNGSELFVTRTGAEQVTYINLHTSQQESITVSGSTLGSNGIAINPSGTTAYVITNFLDTPVNPPPGGGVNFSHRHRNPSGRYSFHSAATGAGTYSSKPRHYP